MPPVDPPQGAPQGTLQGTVQGSPQGATGPLGTPPGAPPEKRPEERHLESARLGARRPELILYDELPRLADIKRRFHHICLVDMAHAVMLWEQGILTPEQARALLRGLHKMAELGPERFPWDDDTGSALVQVERFLAREVGEDLAGRLHTGRSRNDQLTAIDRLYARDQLLKIIGSTLALLDTLLNQAALHVETIMPGYTHLQHAQVWTFGFYLMRFAYAFERDLQRLRGAYERCNMSALGGAACAGTSWPIDRERTAALLAHRGVVVNAIDAGAFARDYVDENVCVLSIYMQNMGRLASDLYIWSTYEFGMVEMDDGLCGTSSIMPQKKNPHALERVKATAGQAVGWPAAIMGTQRSNSSTDLDLIFARDLVMNMFDDVFACSELMRVSLETMQVHADVMRERSAVYWSTTSHLADELVRRLDVSFRTAHQIVGGFVRAALEGGYTPHNAPVALLHDAVRRALGRDSGLTEAELREILDGEGFVRSRASTGGVQPESVRAQIDDVRSRWDEHRRWYDENRAAVEAGVAALRARVAQAASEAGA